MSLTTKHRCAHEIELGGHTSWWVRCQLEYGHTGQCLGGGLQWTPKRSSTFAKVTYPVDANGAPV